MVDRFDRIWDLVDASGDAGDSDRSHAVTRRWVFDTDEPIAAGPVGVAGRLYVGAGSSLYVLEAGSGNAVRRIDLPGPVGSRPVVTDVSAYCRTGDGGGELVAVDPSTGDRQWRVADDAYRRSTTNGRSHGLAVGTDGIYLTGENGKLVSLDADTGARRWTASVGDRVTSGPTLAGRQVVVGSVDGYVYALDAATGSGEWRVHAGERVDAVSTAVESGDGSDRVYASCRARTEGDRTFGRVWSLDAASGERHWTIDTDGPVDGHVAASEDVIHVTDGAGLLYGIFADTGEGLWARHLGGTLSSPVAHAGSVFVHASDGVTRSIDTESGRLEWTHEGSDEAVPYDPVVEAESVAVLETPSRVVGVGLDPADDAGTP